MLASPSHCMLSRMTSPEDRRREKNADLIARWRAGETTALIPSSVIKKDPAALARIFGQPED